MNKKFWIIPLGILALGLSGCASRETRTSVAPAPVKGVQIEISKGWQEEWQRSLEAARKEGLVTLYSNLGSDVIPYCYQDDSII